MLHEFCYRLEMNSCSKLPAFLLYSLIALSVNNTLWTILPYSAFGSLSWQLQQ